jgi:hypothetical protein
VVCFWFGSDVGIYDRVVIQELIKTVAQSHQLETSTQRDFKGLYKGSDKSISFCTVVGSPPRVFCKEMLKLYDIC